MIYTPEIVDYALPIDEWMAINERNNELVSTIDNEAKEKGELLHRFIMEPIADGKAVYQIIKVNKNTVKIKVCTNLGDDWRVPYWGEEATIDKSYAETHVNGRDAMERLFAQHS